MGPNISANNPGLSKEAQVSSKTSIDDSMDYKRSLSGNDGIPLDHLVNVNEVSDKGLRRNSLQIMFIFGCYILLGILVYHYTLGWDFVDSLYFIVITFSTVGYGDLDPKTDNEKLFTSFYLLVGLIAMTTLLGVHLSIVAEHHEALASERNRRIAAKMTEEHSIGLLASMANSVRAMSQSISDATGNLKRTFSTSSLFGSATNSDEPPASGAGSRGELVKRLQEEHDAATRLLSRDDADEDEPPEGQIIKVHLHASLAQGVSSTTPVKSRNSTKVGDKATANTGREQKKPKQEEVRESFTASMREEAAFGAGGTDSIRLRTSNVEAEEENAKGFTRKLIVPASGASMLLANKPSDISSPENIITDSAESCQKKRHIESMRQIMIDQWDADLHQMKRAAIFNIGMIGVILLVGVLAMIHIENWDSKAAFYWACQTVTTVGYGDTPPVSRSGRIFTICYIVIGCGYLALAIADIVKYPMMRRARHLEEKVLKQFGGDLSESKLKMIFDCEMYQRNPTLRSDPSGMSKMEFIVLVLEMMNKVEEKDVLLVSKIFDRLDVNGDGALNQEDMEMIRAQAKARDDLQAQRLAARKSQEERIRKQQNDQESSLGGKLTGHFYDILSSIGLRDSTGSGLRRSSVGRTSGGSGSLIQRSKIEEGEELEDSLTTPLFE